MTELQPPETADDWLGLCEGELPVAEAGEWVVLPRCGATVVFTGTARDHAGDRTGVSLLEYEAYQEQVVPRLEALAAAIIGELVDGRSQVWAVSDAAAEIALLKDWEIVHRQPVTLTPGELTEITLRP